jgi:hypothetical protein
MEIFEWITRLQGLYNTISNRNYVAEVEPKLSSVFYCSWVYVAVLFFLLLVSVWVLKSMF